MRRVRADSLSTADTFWMNGPWQTNASGYSLGLYSDLEQRWLQPGTAMDISRKQCLMRCKTAQVLAQQPAVDTAVVEFAQHTQAYLDTVAPGNSVSSWRNASSMLAAVASQVVDDVCLLAVNENGLFQLIAACVCAPSYWHMPGKLGQSVGVLHRDVPGLNRKLGTSIARFFQALAIGPIVERRNWFVHQSPELYQPEREEVSQTSWQELPLDALWIRCERQTLRKLSPSLTVFSIGVTVRSLAELVCYPASTVDMLQALKGKDAQEAAAFGGEEKVGAIANRLRQLLSGAH